MRDAEEIEELILKSRGHGDDSSSVPLVFNVTDSRSSDSKRAAREKSKHEIVQREENRRLTEEVKQLRSSQNRIMQDLESMYANRFSRDRNDSRRPQPARGTNNQNFRPPPRRNFQPYNGPRCTECSGDHWRQYCTVVCTFCGARNSHCEANCYKKKVSLGMAAASPATHPNNIRHNLPPSSSPLSTNYSRGPPRGSYQNPRSGGPLPHPDRLARMANPNGNANRNADASAPNLSCYVSELNDCGLQIIKVGFTTVGDKFARTENAMLDCGSTLSLISYALYAQLFQEGYAEPLRFQKAVIKQAEGNPMSILGVTTISFSIIGESRNASVSYDFMVINKLACPIILGNNFHRHAAAQKDSGTGLVHFPHYDVTCRFRRHSVPLKNQPARSTLLIVENIVLQPISVTSVRVKHAVNDRFEDCNRAGVILGLDRDFREGKLSVPQAIVTVRSGEAVLCIANMSASPLQLLADRPIATFMPVWRASTGDSVILFTLESDPEAGPLNDHLRTYVEEANAAMSAGDNTPLLALHVSHSRGGDPPPVESMAVHANDDDSDSEPPPLRDAVDEDSDSERMPLREAGNDDATTVLHLRTEATEIDSAPKTDQTSENILSDASDSDLTDSDLEVPDLLNTEDEWDTDLGSDLDVPPP